MLKKIGLIVTYNLYESKRHFVAKLAEALKRKDIEVKIFDGESYSRKAEILNDIQKFSPDVTCSFNSIPPLPDGRFLWDWLSIPHLALLVDPSIYSTNLVKSPLAIISCVDRNDCALIKSQKFENVFFLPHAVEKELQADEGQQRPYDVVFIGSCNDYESARIDWQNKYPPIAGKILDSAAEQVFSKENVPLIDALVNSINANSFISNEIDFVTLFSYLDVYTRGKDRVELIRAINNSDIQVHIFGESDLGRFANAHGWDYYVGKQPNVVLHPSVPFLESMEILKKSKICLNSMPFFKDGTHERIFTGLACGSVPVTSASRYIEENFKDGQELIVYQPCRWKNASKRIEDLLSDEDKRKEMAALGRKNVMKNHTWDNRVEQLLRTLPPILAQMS